jgi:ribosomal protein S18 acetylase RimI-like enzyme
MFKIRNSNLKDKKKITELYYELYPKRKKILKNKLIPIQNFNTKTIVFIAEENKKVVGFCWANFIEYGLSKFGYIEELFVRKDYRNKGIGRTLVKEMQKKFKKLKVDALFVTTEKDNIEAMKLYKKLDFKICKGPWFFWTYKNEFKKRR